MEPILSNVPAPVSGDASSPISKHLCPQPWSLCSGRYTLLSRSSDLEGVPMTAVEQKGHGLLACWVDTDTSQQYPWLCGWMRHKIHTDYRFLWRERDGTAILSKGGYPGVAWQLSQEESAPRPCLNRLLLVCFGRNTDTAY